MSFVEGLPLREHIIPEKSHELSCLVDSLGDLAASTSTDRPAIIGIGGYTAMGKTTLARSLAEQLGNASVLSTDAFMLNREERNKLGISGDDPRALDFDGISHAIGKLSRGNSVLVPQYNHATGTHDTSLLIPPSDFILVEGTSSLYPQIVDTFSLRVFLDADLETRRLLTMQTEVGERGYTFEQFEFTWEEIYLKEHELFIAPTKLSADVIVEVDQRRRYTSQAISSCVCL